MVDLTISARVIFFKGWEEVSFLISAFSSSSSWSSLSLIDSIFFSSFRRVVFRVEREGVLVEDKEGLGFENDFCPFWCRFLC